MLKFQNDGGGRRDHNGRSSGGGFGGGRSSAPRREGSFAPRREGSGGGRRTETQVLEKVDLEEALLQEKEVLAESSAPRGEGSSDRAQDVLKVLVTHLDQEDQEETNIYC
jgi:ATP-dependent RNA helicase DeaD